MNYCSYEELLDLPGIRRASAGQILNFREEKGSLTPLPQLVDLMDFTRYEEKSEGDYQDDHWEHGETVKRVDELVRTRSKPSQQGYVTLSTTGFGGELGSEGKSWAERAPSPSELSELSLDDIGEHDSAFYVAPGPTSQATPWSHGTPGPRYPHQRQRSVSQRLTYETPLVEGYEGERRTKRNTFVSSSGYNRNRPSF